MNVRATGVLLRSDTEAELGTFRRDPSELHRSYVIVGDLDPPGADEIYVVAQAFVEFENGERWVSFEHHGHRVSTSRDETLALLRLAEEVAADLIDELGDMRIAGHGTSRWELFSAPRRIELTPELEARLAPLRRG